MTPLPLPDNDLRRLVANHLGVDPDDPAVLKAPQQVASMLEQEGTREDHVAAGRHVRGTSTPGDYERLVQLLVRAMRQLCPACPSAAGGDVHRQEAITVLAEVAGVRAAGASS